MKRYDPQQVEPKWQQTWADTGLYRVTEDTSRPKYYMLTEFPYPSGDGLHAGHIREYTLGDVMARHKRMQGFNVLYPMGFDEFGLPTENYAIKHKIKPQAATAQNVANFRKQFDQLGYMIDWDRQVHTSDPDYYRWTQWLFLRFLEAGLAYQDEIAINWCPKEKTGLANEEVVGGVHERCGTPVEKKLLKQWILRITDYADRLIDGLATVDYPSRIADQQINWIGRSEGAEIDFRLHGITGQDDGKHQVTVYTTRPDTLFGATFVVVAPEVAQGWLDVGWKASDEVRGYVKTAIAKAELERQESKEKTGVDTGIKAVHPLTGEEIPVWVADYVLAGYGTGAIMAVPAHDERDGEFATKFGLPIKPVIEPVLVQTTGSATFRDNEPVNDSDGIIALIKHWKEDKYLGLKWPDAGWGTLLTGGIEEGHTAEQTVLKEIHEETGFKNAEIVHQLGVIHSKYYHEPKKANRFGHAPTFYVELTDDERDEISQEEQSKHELQWLTLAQLKKFLTATSHIQAIDLFEGKFYTGYGVLTCSGEFDGLEGKQAMHAIVAKLFELGVGRHATRYKLRDWIFSRQHYWGEPIPVIHCPKDGVVPVPQDQLPVTLPDVDSYEPTDTGESPLAVITDWVNVSCPKCGGAAKRETDTMPNWAGSNWYYLRYMDARNSKAFVGKGALDYWQQVDMYLGGMEHTTLHLLYSRFCHQFLYDQKLVPTPEPYAARRGQGIVLAPDGRKMSKSLGNVVDPSDIVAKYGADTLRLYVLFMAPYDETTPWSDERLGGVNRFTHRVWSLVQQLAANATAAGEPDGTFVTEVDRSVHKALKKMHDELGGMRFNTAIAAAMELINELNSPGVYGRLLQPAHAELAARTARTLVLMLAPLAPYITEELWHELGEEGSVHVQPWPQYDPALIRDEVAEIAVQVNGKLRGTIVVAVDATEADVTVAAKDNPNVAKHLEGEIVKTIVVPRRLVNFVVR